jgi:uncharacterized protein (TIGR03437 family)
MSMPIVQGFPANIALEFSQLAGTQPPPTVLTMVLENFTPYYQDTANLNTFATQPNKTDADAPAPPAGNFFPLVVVADIASINGSPAKGLYISKNRVTMSAPALPTTGFPPPGTNISAVDVTAFRHDVFKILGANGQPVGSIMASGLSSKEPDPGGPTTITGGGWAITGGTGAFLGVRGQMGAANVKLPPPPPLRMASIREDPSQRQKISAQNAATTTTKQTLALYLIPMVAPQIVGVYHSPVGPGHPIVPVSASNPLKAGQTIVVYATGLGPVNPGVDPGSPFPSNPLAQVNSDVVVTFSPSPLGAAFPDIPVGANAAGFAGSINGYEVNVLVPHGLPGGPVNLRVSAAWIQGFPVGVWA